MREKAAHRQVINAVFQASRAPGTTVGVEVFGASVSIRIDSDEGGLAVVEASWDFIQFDEVDRFPHDVLAMIPGLDCIDSWDYLPPRKSSDSPHAWLALVPQTWVGQLSESVEIVALCGARVVAHRDHEGFPECPRCRESLALLRAHAAKPDR